MAHSPTLFPSDDEMLVPSHDEKSKNLTPSQEEEVLQKKLQLMLQGIPPPSCITISRLTVDEMLSKYKKNESSYNFCDISNASIEEKATPLWYYENKSKVSEDIAVLFQRVQERYIQLETLSSCNVWFQSSLPLTASAKKRSRARQGIGISPGRRLSHLAKRRQVFSCANLQRMADSERRRHIEIKKNKSSSKSRKGERSVLHEKLKTSKRALFMSPEDDNPSQADTSRNFPKRKLFASSEKKKKLPLQESSKQNEVSKWLDRHDFKEQVSRKRTRDENHDQLPERKRKCPRRSLNFNEDDSSRSPANSSINSSSAPNVQMTDIRKEKLLWAVSVTLKENKITRKDDAFKTCASALFMICRKNLEKILNSQTEKGTSEKMLQFARQNISSVLEKLGIHSKNQKSDSSPPLDDMDVDLNQSNRIIDKGKENSSRKDAESSSVNITNGNSCTTSYRTPKKCKKCGKRSKSTTKAKGNSNLRNLGIKWKSLESLFHSALTPVKRNIDFEVAVQNPLSSFHDNADVNKDCTIVADVKTENFESSVEVICDHSPVPNSVSSDVDSNVLYPALMNKLVDTGSTVQISQSDVESDSMCESHESDAIPTQDWDSRAVRLESAVHDLKNDLEKFAGILSEGLEERNDNENQESNEKAKELQDYFISSLDSSSELQRSKNEELTEEKSRIISESDSLSEESVVSNNLPTDEKKLPFKNVSESDETEDVIYSVLEKELLLLERNSGINRNEVQVFDVQKDLQNSDNFKLKILLSESNKTEVPVPNVQNKLQNSDSIKENLLLTESNKIEVPVSDVQNKLQNCNSVKEDLLLTESNKTEDFVSGNAGNELLPLRSDSETIEEDSLPLKNSSQRNENIVSDKLPAELPLKTSESHEDLLPVINHSESENKDPDASENKSLPQKPDYESNKSEVQVFKKKLPSSKSENAAEGKSDSVTNSNPENQPLLTGNAEKEGNSADLEELPLADDSKNDAAGFNIVQAEEMSPSREIQVKNSSALSFLSSVLEQRIELAQEKKPESSSQPEITACNAETEVQNVAKFVESKKETSELNNHSGTVDATELGKLTTVRNQLLLPVDQNCIMSNSQNEQKPVTESECGSEMKSRNEDDKSSNGRVNQTLQDYEVDENILLPSQTSTPILTPSGKSRKLIVKRTKNWKIVKEDDSEHCDVSDLKIKVALSHDWEVISKNSSDDSQKNSTLDASMMSASVDESSYKESDNDVTDKTKRMSHSEIKLEEKAPQDCAPEHLDSKVFENHESHVESQVIPSKDYVIIDIPSENSTVNTEELAEILDIKNGMSPVGRLQLNSSGGMDSNRKRKVLSLESYKARRGKEKEDLDGISPIKWENDQKDPETENYHKEPEFDLKESEQPKKIYNIRLKHPIGKSKEKISPDKHKQKISPEKHKQKISLEKHKLKISPDKYKQKMSPDKYKLKLSPEHDKYHPLKKRRVVEKIPQEENEPVKCFLTALSTLSTLSSVLEKQIKLAQENSGMQKAKESTKMSQLGGKDLIRSCQKDPNIKESTKMSQINAQDLTKSRQKELNVNELYGSYQKELSVKESTKIGQLGGKDLIRSCQKDPNTKDSSKIYRIEAQELSKSCQKDPNVEEWNKSYQKDCNDKELTKFYQMGGKESTKFGLKEPDIKDSSKIYRTEAQDFSRKDPNAQNSNGSCQKEPNSTAIIPPPPPFLKSQAEGIPQFVPNYSYSNPYYQGFSPSVDNEMSHNQYVGINGVPGYGIQQFSSPNQNMGNYYNPIINQSAYSVPNSFLYQQNDNNLSYSYNNYSTWQNQPNFNWNGYQQTPSKMVDGSNVGNYPGGTYYYSY